MALKIIMMFLMLFKLLCIVYAKDMVTINFIKSFIQNENKPTSVIYRNICWKKSELLELTKELTGTNTRTSSNYRDNGYLQMHMMLFLADLNCDHAKGLFVDLNLLRFPYRWLVLYDHRNQNQSRIQHLLDLPLLADSDFVLAEQNGHSFTLTELHKPSTFGPMHFNPRGVFNGKESKLTDTRPARELFRRRQDVMGHPLTMSNVVQESNSSEYHLIKEDRLELQYDAIGKLAWMHVRLAFEMLNATPRYIFNPSYGYIRNGEWIGMFNDLKTGKADLGTNCMPFVERLAIAQFTSPVAKFKTRFLFRQPPLSSVSNIFSLPFSPNVWIAVVVCVIISIISIKIATKWEVSQTGMHQSQLDGSIGDATLLTMCALSQQGCSKEPQLLSGRIILVIVLTALMALYAAYSANIVVLLQAPSESIKTLEQLAHSKMTLAAIDIDANRYVLKRETDPLRRFMYSKIEPAKGKAHFYELDEGIKLLRQGQFALHSSVDSMYRRIENTFLESEKCDLTEVDFMNTPDPYVPVYKHSPYLELLRVTFKRIYETGIQAAQHKRLLVPKPQCTDRGSAFTSVGVQHLRAVLLFFLYGVGAAILILFAEILIYKICDRPNAV